MYVGGKPEDMYPPGGPPPPGAGDVYATANSGAPYGGYGPPPPGGGYYPPPPPGGYYGPPTGAPGGGYYPQGGGGYGYPPSGGYPPPSPGGYYGPPPQSIPMQPTGPYRPGHGSSDPEYNLEDFTGFTDPEVRKGFIQKVYTLLSVQLLITAAIVYPFLYVDAVQEFADDHAYLMFVAMIALFVLEIVLVCCESVRRAFPCNLILLVLLTIAMGVMCGFISSRYNTHIVLITLGITAVICVSVTLIACFAPIDITGCGLLMCVLACGLAIFSLIGGILAVVLHLKVITLVIAGAAVVIFSLFLIYDTQQIMGGKRIELSPEEYVLGALQLYVDVIQIFLNLLPLVSAIFGDD